MIQGSTPAIGLLATLATGYRYIKADGTTGNGGGTIAQDFYPNTFTVVPLAGETNVPGPFTIIPDNGGHTGSAGNPLLLEIIPAFGAVPGDAMTLTAAYDLAKTAAQAGAAMTLTAGERNDIAAALLDLADAVETGITVRKAFRAMAAVLAGKAVVGGGHSVYSAVNNAGTTRVDGTTPGGGARTAVSLTL